MFEAEPQAAIHEHRLETSFACLRQRMTTQTQADPRISTTKTRVRCNVESSRMALRAYTGLRPCRGHLVPNLNILRQSIPAAIVPSRVRDMGTSARVCFVRKHRFDEVQ